MSQLVWRLIVNNPNLIYIDKYTVGSIEYEVYNWVKKREKVIIDKSLYCFKTSIIIAVFKENIF